MKQYVTKNYLTGLEVSLKSMSKKSNFLITKEEALTRINTMHAEVLDILKDRPDFKFVK